MPFTDYALDMMATRLSQFTNPNIPELLVKDDKPLQTILLENVVGVFSGKADARHRITDAVRRVFASIETYQLGRKHALDYVNGERHSRISPYFLSLTFFESCLAYSWQICDLVYKVGKLGKGKGKGKVFEEGDGSALERLHSIYTYGTKHYFGMYDGTIHGEMPTTIWLTNDGIECINGAKITFVELSEVIEANNGLFYDVQKAARDAVSGSKESQLPGA